MKRIITTLLLLTPGLVAAQEVSTVVVHETRSTKRSRSLYPVLKLRRVARVQFVEVRRKESVLGRGQRIPLEGLRVTTLSFRNPGEAEDYVAGLKPGSSGTVFAESRGKRVLQLSGKQISDYRTVGAVRDRVWKALKVKPTPLGALRYTTKAGGLLRTTQSWDGIKAYEAAQAAAAERHRRERWPMNAFPLPTLKRSGWDVRILTGNPWFRAKIAKMLPPPMKPTRGAGVGLGAKPATKVPTPPAEPKVPKKGEPRKGIIDRFEERHDEK